MPYGGINFTYDKIIYGYRYYEFQEPTEWKLATFENEESKKATNDKFFSFDHENCSLQLDQYEAEESWVLTEIRFLKGTNDKKTHFLKLDARFTQFDATTGLLNSTSTYWVSNRINSTR